VTPRVRAKARLEALRAELEALPDHAMPHAVRVLDAALATLRGARGVRRLVELGTEIRDLFTKETP